ncbi:MAG: hypothetical protein EOO09_04865 [Chitinophagaceae bacterium]|nr:MAG: hypothetical protein EOO09_04865 [Chitinophagaceae bacterium]
MLKVAPFLACLLLTASVTSSFAQPTNEKGWYDSKDLEDVQVGWLETIQYKLAPGAVVKNGWTYPAVQGAFTQKLVTDWQRTYSPKGLLGEMIPSILAPVPALPIGNRSYEYNEAEKDNKRALPNTYGAFARLHKCLVRNSKHKFFPMPGNWCYTTWNVMANNVELISRQMAYLSSPEDYYCIQPRYTIGMKGQYEKDWRDQMAQYRDFTNSPNLKKFDHYLRPDANLYVVVLTRDGKPLPFEQVTMGEYIARLEKQLPTMYKIAMNMNIRSTNLLENAQRGIRILKNNYKNRLGDYVYFTDVNNDIDCLDLAGIEEAKEITWIGTQPVKQGKNGWVETAFPLLHLKKEAKQACATGGPQWIVCTIQGALDESFGGCSDLMDNFTSRFNYDYLYNYYFENKTTQAYTVVPFATQEEKQNNQASTALSDNAKRLTADKSVLFFEDFSSVATGGSPKNWTTEKNHSGDGVSVGEVDGVKGKWLKLQKKATPKQLALDLKDDFEFSMDLLVRKGDVPWGTPGIVIELPFMTSAGEKKFTFDISPGDMNRKDAEGWVMFNFGNAGCTMKNYYSLPDFKGSAPVNQSTVKLRKTGSTISFVSGNKVIYECNTSYNADMRLKGFSLVVNEKNLYHVSNISIRKL